MAKTKIKYACNYCDSEPGFYAETTEQFVAHYRKEHPEAAANCWDQIGDVGDEFANVAMQEFRNRAHEAEKRAQSQVDELERLGNREKELVDMYNKLANRLQIIQLVLSGS